MLHAEYSKNKMLSVRMQKKKEENQKLKQKVYNLNSKNERNQIFIA